MKLLSVIITLLGTAAAHDDHHLRHLRPNENANEMAHLKFEHRPLPPADVAYKRKNGNIEPGIRCVPDIRGPKETRELKEESKGNLTSRKLAGGNINVVFHVIYKERRGVQEGNIPKQWIDDQMDVINAAYQGRGFSFSLAEIQRHASNKYYTGCYNQDSRMKADYAVDPANYLNVYTCSPSGGTLGYAYLPDSFSEDNYRHGCVVLDESLPGGSAEPYNLGQTLTHEVGHYLGLEHTFSGGCDGEGDQKGDFVADTPAEANAAYGCPAGRDTCPDGGEDPIHNFMDYTDDFCMTEFTQGQATRMAEETSQYRPSITSSPTGSTVSSSTSGATTSAATTGATTSVATTGATCLSLGNDCVSASDCCSNKCTGKPEAKTCK